MQDQKMRPRGLHALPPGAFAALAGALMVGVLAGAGLYLWATGAVATYAVVADRSPRRPPRWVVLVTAGVLLTVCVMAAQARGRIDWALGFLLAAAVCGYGGVVVKAAPLEGDEATTADHAEPADTNEGQSGEAPPAPAPRR